MDVSGDISKIETVRARHLRAATINSGKEFGHDVETLGAAIWSCDSVSRAVWNS